MTICEREKHALRTELIRTSHALERLQWMVEAKRMLGLKTISVEAVERIVREARRG